MTREPAPPRTGGQLRTRAEQSEPGRVLAWARHYSHHVIAAAVALMVGAALALVWRNAPWAPAYETFWSTPVVVRIGAIALREDLRGLVVDGLMSIFFFVVTLEVKQELVAGALSDLRRAAFPLAGAIGGVVVPALIFLAVNLGLPDGNPGAWGIPVATDVAFSIGALALIGAMTGPLRTLMLSMTVADDVTVIVLVAVVYSSGLEPMIIVIGGLLAVLAYLMLRFGIHSPVPYLAVGVALWLTLHAAGIHPTIAGVAMAAVVPARPPRAPADAAEAIAQTLDTSEAAEGRDEEGGHGATTEAAMGRIGELSSATEAPAERISRVVQPWSRFLVLPVFAVAAAGVPIPVDRLGEVATSPIALGIVLGLVVGKPLGIVGAMWLVEVAGLAHRPRDVGWRQLVGIGLLGGIGFTVALFITPLALEDTTAQETAKLGILAGSVLAGSAGLLWLATVGLGAARQTGDGTEAEGEEDRGRSA